MGSDAVVDLHPYDAPERATRQTWFVIAVVATGLAFGAGNAVETKDVDRFLWIFGPSIPTFLGALFYVWDRWVWKWRRLGRIPDLSGRYTGRVFTDDPVIAPLLGEGAPCELVITQRWLRISVAFSSRASTSRSHTARVQTKGTGFVELVYVYYARPRDPTQREHFPAHLGTAVMMQPGQRDHLEAYFWTSPWPQHSGRLELHRVGSSAMHPHAGTLPKKERQSVPRLIVDCDPGLDDALALLYVSALHKAAECEIALVTAAAGNVPMEQSYANARYVLARAGIGDVALAAGSPSPLVGAPPAKTATSFHGITGLDSVEVSNGDLPSEDVDKAAHHIVETVRSFESQGETCSLLCLAPLTNIAKALLIDPGIVESIDSCVIMGGALRYPRGNIEEWAEFNVWWDPAAAKAVIESGLSVRLVPLDATHLVPFGRSDLDEVTGLVHVLLQARIELNEKTTGKVDAWLHDAIAALAVTDEDLFDWRPARVEVVVTGAAGQTREGSDLGGAEILVGAPRDSHEIKDRFLTVLHRLDLRTP